jgi:hypothetical protein
MTGKRSAEFSDRVTPLTSAIILTGVIDTPPSIAASQNRRVLIEASIFSTSASAYTQLRAVAYHSQVRISISRSLSMRLTAPTAANRVFLRCASTERESLKNTR